MHGNKHLFSIFFLLILIDSMLLDKNSGGTKTGAYSAMKIWYLLDTALFSRFGSVASEFSLWQINKEAISEQLLSTFLKDMFRKCA
ncbi:hypothetical protein ACJX0J_006234 [Zea mays]